MLPNGKLLIFDSYTDSGTRGSGIPWPTRSRRFPTAREPLLLGPHAAARRAHPRGRRPHRRLRRHRRHDDLRSGDGHLDRRPADDVRALVSDADEAARTAACSSSPVRSTVRTARPGRCPQRDRGPPRDLRSRDEHLVGADRREPAPAALSPHVRSARRPRVRRDDRRGADRQPRARPRDADVERGRPRRPRRRQLGDVPARQDHQVGHGSEPRLPGPPTPSARRG